MRTTHINHPVRYIIQVPGDQCPWAIRDTLESAEKTRKRAELILDRHVQVFSEDEDGTRTPL
jgi:hypothetical protein